MDEAGARLIHTPPQSQAQNRRKGGGGVRSGLVVSDSGESRVVEVGKQSIMRRTWRDLRALDPVLSYPSSILGRERAIVINLEHIKAIVTAKEVLIISSTNPLVVDIVRDLHHRIPSSNFAPPQQRIVPIVAVPNKSLPFGFRALESCLESACGCLESQVRDEIEHLLDDDNDMAEMYLTEKLIAAIKLDQTLPREDTCNATLVVDDERVEESRSEDGSESVIFFKPNIEELEMLLEAYFAQINGILQKLSDEIGEELGCDMRNLAEIVVETRELVAGNIKFSGGMKLRQRSTASAKNLALKKPEKSIRKLAKKHQVAAHWHIVGLSCFLTRLASGST
ncbi:Magnesium transporter MRS2-F [Trema orientale]|uniref:Magnesium transporter MRS2-F n=1 Tax=Trema orientale TaxID=63057 RepID=A0A2P5CL82_TREOI|nr:Magnesium transporter MRS2-F [Trema orientale]